MAGFTEKKDFHLFLYIEIIILEYLMKKIAEIDLILIHLDKLSPLTLNYGWPQLTTLKL